MKVNKKITELRERHNISQKELALKLDINASVLNRIELGSRPLRDDELIKIANFFGVTTDYLLGYSLKQKPHGGNCP